MMTTPTSIPAPIAQNKTTISKPQPSPQSNHPIKSLLDKLTGGLL